MIKSVSPRDRDRRGDYTEPNESGLRCLGFALLNNRGSSSTVMYAIVFIVAAALFLYLNQQTPSPTNVAQRQHRPQAQATASLNSDANTGNISAQEPLVASDDVEITAALDAANAGEYAKAAGLLRVARVQYPDSPKVTGLLTTVLNNNALKMMDSERYAEAKDLFTEAGAISSDPTITRNLAQALIKLHAYKEAAQTLETLPADHSTNNTLEWLYTRIADKAHDENRADEAIIYYEKLAALKPNDAKLKKFITGLKKEAASESKMGSAEGSHFTVKYEGGENAVAGHVIKLMLEEAYYKIGVDMEFYPDDRIEALLYSKETFRDVTGSPSWAGALYDGRIKVPAGGVTDKNALLEKVLFHEYTHAVVHRLSGGRAPVWLNEGLAQLESNDSDVIYKKDLKASAIAFKQTRKVYNVLRVLEGSFMGYDTNQAQSAYLLSLSATQYLVKEFGRYAAIRILKNLRDGKNMDDAVSESINMSYDDFFETWMNSLVNS